MLVHETKIEMFVGEILRIELCRISSVNYAQVVIKDSIIVQLSIIELF